MSIANLKKLVSAFNVPHAESTTQEQECLHCVCEAAREEVEALEKAAKAFANWAQGGNNAAGPTAAIELMERITKEST